MVTAECSAAGQQQPYPPRVAQHHRSDLQQLEPYRPDLRPQPLQQHIRPLGQQQPELVGPPILTDGPPANGCCRQAISQTRQSIHKGRWFSITGIIGWRKIIMFSRDTQHRGRTAALPSGFENQGAHGLALPRIITNSSALAFPPPLAQFEVQILNNKQQ
jgi:hypothetical protein